MKIGRKVVSELREYFAMREKIETSHGIDGPLSKTAPEEKLDERRKSVKAVDEECKPLLDEEVQLSIPMIDSKALKGVKLRASSYRLLWFIFPDDYEPQEEDEADE
jgi:hypothetical protein